MARKIKRPPLAPPPRFSSRLYVRLPQPQTRLFRYLLEAYDNLAYTSVTDRKACILKVIYTPQCEKHLLDVLEDIRTSVPFEYLDVPLLDLQN